MLSILIPTYNYNLTLFVEELDSQCKNIKSLKYEILCYDDCSTNKNLQKINKEINNIPNCTYKILEKNIGRSKIRNLLADEAKGDWLLFLDCDSLTCSKNFIKTYINSINNTDIVCGGTKYQNKIEIKKEYLLHWKNGKKREENKKHFTTNNFLIRKSIFNILRFDETINGYGHEDTIFGRELKKHNFKIVYIDNPVYHLGLKTTDKFIMDIVNAEKNLKILYNNPQYHNNISDLSIIKAYNKLKALHLTTIYSFIIKLLSPLIIKNLHSKNPHLYLLDLYKLYKFINL